MHISGSIGIAVTPPLEADAEGLLRHADAAMYEAKARGRSRSQIFDALRGALARAAPARRRPARRAGPRPARLRYQPILELDDGGWSASRRCPLGAPDPGLGLAGEFVPLAEHYGFVSDLDRWVLTRACREARAGQLAGGCRRRRVAVNLSAAPSATRPGRGWSVTCSPPNSSRRRRWTSRSPRPR